MSIYKSKYKIIQNRAQRYSKTIDYSVPQPINKPLIHFDLGKNSSFSMNY